MASKKVTLDEVEAILNEEGDARLSISPSGEMLYEDQAPHPRDEVEKLRADLEAQLAAAEERAEDRDYWKAKYERRKKWQDAAEMWFCKLADYTNYSAHQDMSTISIETMQFVCHGITSIPDRAWAIEQECDSLRTRLVEVEAERDEQANLKQEWKDKAIALVAERDAIRRELAHYKAGQKVGGRVEEIVAAHEAYREVKAELEECRQEQKKAKAEEIQGIKRAAHHRDAFIDMAHEHAAEHDAALERERGLREALGWIAQQPCRQECEGASGNTPCSETGACATEWCLSCYALAAQVKPRGACGHGVTMPVPASGDVIQAWCYICGAFGTYRNGQIGPMRWRLPDAALKAAVTPKRSNDAS